MNDLELTPRHYASMQWGVDEERHCFTLAFPYDSFIVVAVKQLPTAQWSKARKRWEFVMSAGVYAELAVFARRELISKEQLRPYQHELINLNSHKFHTKPYAHQREAVEFILKEFGFEVKNDKK